MEYDSVLFIDAAVRPVETSMAHREMDKLHLWDAYRENHREALIFD